MASDEELARLLWVHFQILMFQFFNRARCSCGATVILCVPCISYLSTEKKPSWLFWQSFCLYDFLEYILLTGILQIFVRTIICSINSVKLWRKIRGANDIQCFSSVRAPHNYPSSRKFCLYLFHKSHEATHCREGYKLHTNTTVLSSAHVFITKHLQLFHKSLNIFQLPHLKDLNQF